MIVTEIGQSIIFPDFKVDNWTKMDGAYEYADFTMIFSGTGLFSALNYQKILYCQPAIDSTQARSA